MRLNILQPEVAKVGANPLPGRDNLTPGHLIAVLKAVIFAIAGFCDLRISAIVADVALDHNLIFAI